MVTLARLAVDLYPDERAAVAEMRSAGRFASDEEVVLTALWAYAERIDAPIHLEADTFGLDRTRQLSLLELR